jgi:hypothetical protein
VGEGAAGNDINAGFGNVLDRFQIDVAGFLTQHFSCNRFNGLTQFGQCHVVKQDHICAFLTYVLVSENRR